MTYFIVTITSYTLYFITAAESVHYIFVTHSNILDFYFQSDICKIMIQTSSAVSIIFTKCNKY